MNERCLITVGVDGSTGGRRALAWALRHGAAWDANVEVVTAHNWVAVALESGATSGPEDLRLQMAERQKIDMDRVLADFEGAPPRVSAELVEGDPVDVLITAARDSDLLVLGSHGQGRLTSALLGSVSEGCVRRGTTPVLIVPARD